MQAPLTDILEPEDMVLLVIIQQPRKSHYLISWHEARDSLDGMNFNVHPVQRARHITVCREEWFSVFTEHALTFSGSDTPDVIRAASRNRCNLADRYLFNEEILLELICRDYSHFVVLPSSV